MKDNRKPPIWLAGIVHDVGTLAEYASLAGRGDVRDITMPLWLYDDTEIVKRMPRPRRSVDLVLDWAVHETIDRLATLPPVRTIQDARETAQHASRHELARLLSDWAYTIDLHDTRPRPVKARIAPEGWDHVATLANDLGLTRTTVACLSIMAAFVQIDLPARHHQYMVAELRRFKTALRERADFVSALVAGIEPDGTESATLDDVLGDDA